MIVHEHAVLYVHTQEEARARGWLMGRDGPCWQGPQKETQKKQAKAKPNAPIILGWTGPTEQDQQSSQTRAQRLRLEPEPPRFQGRAYQQARTPALLLDTRTHRHADTTHPGKHS